jgi:hypothetical protein
LWTVWLMGMAIAWNSPCECLFFFFLNCMIYGNGNSHVRTGTLVWMWTANNNVNLRRSCALHRLHAFLPLELSCMCVYK